MTYHIDTQVKCFSDHKADNSVPIYLVEKSKYKKWIKEQDDFMQRYCKTIGLGSKVNIALIPAKTGKFYKAVSVFKNKNMFVLASLVEDLIDGDYHLDASCTKDFDEQVYLGFALGMYSFDVYKNNKKSKIKLFLPQEYQYIVDIAVSVYFVRDMINLPAQDMRPDVLSTIMKQFSTKFDARFNEILGKDLLDSNYPGVYHVGKGSHQTPRLMTLEWGDKNHPTVSIIGKGVCFDTGGLDLKSLQGMSIMHKDMAGAANAMGLAYLIMNNNVPVHMRLTIPAVENAIGGACYHPSDIIRMRNGKTVQITSTDAEGRLIIADALTEESKHNPDLLVDYTTLTGASRVALGTEVSAFFTRNSELANHIYRSGINVEDPAWRMPLVDNYRRWLKSDFADMLNSSYTPYGGSIIAALFLDEFVSDKLLNWVHFDMMAWNTMYSPGRPIGGEAMCLRTMYDVILNHIV